MPREVEPSQNEKAFVLKALSEQVRLDGRALDQYRPIDLTFGDAYGVVDIKLGKTRSSSHPLGHFVLRLLTRNHRVLANVSAEVTVPYLDRPADGIFNIVTELSPMISPAIEVNRPTEAEVLLSRLLEKTVRRSGALDTESLCLVGGRKCWSVRVDVHVLSHDGNLVDASCLAVVAALRSFRRPDTSIEGGVLTVYTPAEREPVPLSWLHSPLCVTFSFFGNEDAGGGGGGGGGTTSIAVLDATWLEEQFRTSSCTISLSKHGEICQISKLGGAPVEAVALLQCTQLALARVKELSDLLDRRLAEDAKARDKGGLMVELRAENDRES